MGNIIAPYDEILKKKLLRIRYNYFVNYTSLTATSRCSMDVGKSS